MPSLEFHRHAASENKITLRRLLSALPEDSADNKWILTVAYYTALHLIEATADTLVPNNQQIRSHADRLDFLETKSSRIKQLFNKMHILTKALQYGTSSESSVLEEAVSLFKTTGFRSAVQKWLSEIERVLNSL